MSDNKALFVASLCAITTLALIWKWRGSRAGLPLPPGPKGLPVLGNALEIPRNIPSWETFTSLTRQFDTNVLYLRILTTDFVVLSSSEAVSDLCDKRSDIYADRPLLPMFELMDVLSWAVPVMRYGNLWRNSRRIIHEFMNVRAVKRFDGHQRRHAYHFLLNLAGSPERFFEHAELTMGALVMQITYGIDVVSTEDRFLRAFAKGTEVGKRALTPGAFLINEIPSLKYVPEWFPGAGFKTFARAAGDQLNIIANEPLKHVKELIKHAGESSESESVSIAWSCFNRGVESPSQGIDESVIRAATATMYSAAVETTVAVLQTFFLAMALNPHVARKAQDELDQVVGERMPDFSDMGDLPYVLAIIKELFRWGCPFPLGLPKRAMEDDAYNGYFIPAGATILENIWAIFRDESVYPTPDTYDPERYLKNGRLDPSASDPEERIFGSGRRICPGKHFAMRSLFLKIACTLLFFNIEAPDDANIEVKFEEDTIRRPGPFKCRITPRSEAKLKLMKSMCTVANH